MMAGAHHKIHLIHGLKNSASIYASDRLNTLYNMAMAMQTADQPMRWANTSIASERQRKTDAEWMGNDGEGS